LIFGPSKLADLGKSLGEGLKNFKKGIAPDDDPNRPKPPSGPAATPYSPAPSPAAAPPPAAAPSQPVGPVAQTPAPGSPDPAPNRNDPTRDPATPGSR